MRPRVSPLHSSSEKEYLKLLLNESRVHFLHLKQYQIILVNLDPTIGSEIKKTRPCIVISPDEMNKFLRTVMIAPMTTKSKSYPTRVKVKHQRKTGWIVIDQLRTIDKKRIIRILGELSSVEIDNTKKIIRETLVD